MKKIDEIELFFKDFEFSDEPIELNKATVIRNPTIFIASHLDMLRGNNSRKIKKPYWERLFELYKILKNERNMERHTKL